MDNREKNRLKAAAYRKKNPEKVREIQNRNAEKARQNPDKVEAIRGYQLKYRDQNREVLKDKERERRFGINRQEYAEMFHAHNGACAICSQPETATRNGRIKALAVDHDHESGEIRGLLCSDCNTGIGKLKEDRDIMVSAIRYLDKHKKAKHCVVNLSLV